MCICACCRRSSAPFLAHGSVDFVHTSGGRTTAWSDRIRAQEPGNLLSWAELHRLSNRGIVADTGYGVGGKITSEPGMEAAWLDADNLRDRIADGVVAVTFANPEAGWEHRLGRLRSVLPPARRCFAASAPSYAAHRRGSLLSPLKNSTRTSGGRRAPRGGGSGGEGRSSRSHSGGSEMSGLAIDKPPSPVSVASSGIEGSSSLENALFGGESGLARAATFEDG